jgi:hypothetical protein
MLVPLYAAGMLALVSSVSRPVVLQQAVASDSLMTCRDDLDALDAKLKANYAGFLLEVTGEKRRRYEEALSRLRTRAEGTRRGDCYFVLRDYLRWFEDPHLFVYQNDSPDSAEGARRASALARLDMNEAKARAYFRRNAAHLDPIEGIWYDVGLRVAVIPEPAAPAGRFVAVVLESDTSTWPLGAIRARFARRDDGSYETEMSTRNLATRHVDGVIRKRVVLRLSPHMWGKAFPVARADSGLLDPTNPRRPTVTTRRGTVVISMTSHDPSYAPLLDSLVTAHEADLRTARRIVIDVRGNEGGSSWMSDVLLPYVLSKTKRSSPFDSVGPAMMIASDDQIKYASRAFGPDTSIFVRRLVEAMRAHPGQLVPLVDPSLPPEPVKPDSVIDGNWKVAVLIDHGTVSAPEVLVLKALRSQRATVIGESTEGALDYQSTNIVWFSPRERRWGLGYPTITADARLPVGGMRGKGIAPDVHLDWKRVADPIAEVERLLDRR